MKRSHKKTLTFFGLSQILLLSAAGMVAYAQDQTASGSSTTGDSSPITTSGTASPSANVSTATTGGTNINYQTNNAYNNENGFAPGIFCRTPTMYVGGNYGNSNQNNTDTTSAQSSAQGTNYSANVGVLVPFGSSVLKNCADLANQITLDRKISNDLSMIRACAGLEKEGIAVDPDIYPYLERCARKKVLQMLPRTSMNGNAIPLIQQQTNKSPKTNKS
jgi:hypothetical protein